MWKIPATHRGDKFASSALMLWQVAAIRHLFGARNRFWKRGNVTSSDLTWRENNWCFLIGWFKFCRSDLWEMRTHAFAYFVAAICRTNSNQFECVRQIATTKFCRIDNDFHMSHEACLSGPTLDKVKIWKRQIFSKILEEPKKFCQSSASEPILTKSTIVMRFDMTFDDTLRDGSSFAIHTLEFTLLTSLNFTFTGNVYHKS